MSEITFTGYQYFGCGEHDLFHTGFVATNSAGRRVSGVVCCGGGPLSKACTVRW